MALPYIKTKEEIVALKPEIHGKGLHVVTINGKKKGYSEVYLNGADTPSMVETRIPAYVFRRK